MIGESKMFVVDTAEGQSYLVNTEDKSVDPNNLNIRENDNGGELAISKLPTTNYFTSFHV